jgi:hypothetical protein
LRDFHDRCDAGRAVHSGTLACALKRRSASRGTRRHAPDARDRAPFLRIGSHQLGLIDPFGVVCRPLSAKSANFFLEVNPGFRALHLYPPRMAKRLSSGGAVHLNVEAGHVKNGHLTGTSAIPENSRRRR